MTSQSKGFQARKCTLAVLSVVAPICSMSLIAQVEPETQNASEQLGETIVIGTRLNQQITDVSSPVTIITAEEIEAVQARDLGDLLSYTPGVDVDSDSRWGIKSINIRGLSGNYVKIKIDNVDAPSDFQVGTGSLIGSARVDLDIDMLKAVEIIRGPASSSQGSDAIGGLVMLETKSARDFVAPGESWGGHAKTIYNSEAASFGQSVALANISGNFENLIAFGNNNSVEVDDYSEQTPEDTHKQTLLLKSKYLISDQSSIEFSLDMSNTDTEADPSSTSYDVFYYTTDESERARYGVKYAGRFNTAIFDQFQAQLDWQEKEQSAKTFRSTTDYFGSGFPRQDLKDYAYLEEGYVLDLQFNKSFQSESSESSLAYGLTYRSTDYENVNVTYQDVDFDGDYFGSADTSQLYYYMPHSESTTVGVYLQNQFSLLDDRLKLTPGVRYDRFEHDPFNLEPTDIAETDSDTGFSVNNSYEPYSDSEVTARLGAVFALNDELKIFGQYSEGFKAPDFNQLYYSWSNDTQGYKSEPNSDLESEYSDSYELGLRSNSEWGSFEVSVFNTDFTNFIGSERDTSDPDYPFGITRNVNIEEFEIKGVEFSTQVEGGDAMPGAWASFAFSYTEGEDQNGDARGEIAPWSGVLGLNYDSPASAWGSSLRVKYTDAVEASDFEEGVQFAPGSSVVMDLTAYYRPLDQLTLRAGVFNLTDEKYYRWSNIREVAPLDSSALYDEYAEAKRSFSMSAKYDF